MQGAGTLHLRRDAIYLGEPDRALFSCFHAAEHGPGRDCVAVICNPLGHEYVHSHRSVRHLADRLAEAGIPALRFDYDGTGDSPGTDLDPDRLSRWLDDIHIAIDAARSLSGCTKVCLVGLRLGSLLAVLATARGSVDYLVLWSPCVSGRRYIREMQALALAAEQAVASPAGVLEAAGFCMSQQTQQQLGTMEILECQVGVKQRALLLLQHDAKPDTRLQAHLRRQSVETDVATFSGYAEMMAEPQNTVVPLGAIDSIVDWVRRHAPLCKTDLAPRDTKRTAQLRLKHVGSDHSAVALTETACRFGEGNSLFGVHCQATGQSSARPTVVLFNSGVVHRVGPNRLYVELARNLAAQGFETFRCDLGGIGDSVLQAPGSENHSYPATAELDARTAMNFLKESFGARAFVLMGLCSGAYTSFTAGLAGELLPIAELILINPLTFRWKEGTSLDTRHFKAVAHYKGTVRRLESWKKLLSGNVDVANLLNVAGSHVKKQLESYRNIAAERWFPSAAPLLSRQLQQLFAQGTKMTLFVASGDPGWDMLTAHARYATRRAVESKELSVHFIPQADHTFTSSSARQRLGANLCAHLVSRYKV